MIKLFTCTTAVYEDPYNRAVSRLPQTEHAYAMKESPACGVLTKWKWVTNYCKNIPVTIRDIKYCNVVSTCMYMIICNSVTYFWAVLSIEYTVCLPIMCIIAGSMWLLKHTGYCVFHIDPLFRTHIHNIMDIIVPEGYRTNIHIIQFSRAKTKFSRAVAKFLHFLIE